MIVSFEFIATIASKLFAFKVEIWKMREVYPFSQIHSISYPFEVLRLHNRYSTPHFLNMFSIEKTRVLCLS